MYLEDIVQPDIIWIEEKLRLRTPDLSEWSMAIPWYSDEKVMYFSEGVENKVYDINMINKMYKYLSNIGELYFIEVFENGFWIAVGDVTLSEDNMPIVIGNPKYWSRGISKKVLLKLINRGKLMGFKKIYIPTIYTYNKRSQNLFSSMGFIQVYSDENKKSYELKL